MLNRKTDSPGASSEYPESPDRSVQAVVENRLLSLSSPGSAACGRSAADARAGRGPARQYLYSRFLGSLLLGLFVLAGVLAEAQTVTTLVSNAEQAANTGGTNQIVAQSFTTGPHGTGYTLSSVRIRPFSASTALDRSGTYVTVKTDSGGEPGATLATLSDPNTDFTGFDVETFSAAANTTLEPDTTYWVVVNEEQSTAHRLGLGSTGSQAQDSDSLPGWEIGDNRLHRSGGTWTSAPSPLLIDVQGYDNGNPSLSVAPGSATEGSTVRFTVTLDDPAEGVVTVQYATSDGSATAGADYTAATARTLTIPVGQVSATIEVGTIDDTDDEGDETFTLTLSDPSSNADLGATASVTGTIVDNDGKPSLIIAGASAAEGSNLEFTVTASNAATADVTVQYSTSIASDDTASTGDFAAASAETLTIAAGEETATISIASIDDPDDEDDETFSLTLSSPSSNAELGLQVSAKGTIEDDDEPGIALSTPTLEVTEGSDATYTVTLATRPTGTVTVTIDAGSNSGVTLSTTRQVFTAADWNQARTVIVSAAHDADADPGSATITHSASGPGYESVSGQLPVSVVDDDAPAILISPAPLQVSENDTARYTVALATLPTHRVTLNLSGLANTGLTVQPSQLVFDTDNWNTPQSVELSVAADLDADDSRATLTYTGSGGDYEGASEQLEVDILDTVSASLVISTSRLQVKEGEAATYFVSLAPAPPTGNVTVRITPDSSQLRLGALSFGATGTLVFTPGNWDVPREVSVTAGEDVDEAPDHDALQHVASGGGFGSAPAVELPVLVEDDDVQRGYVFSQSELRVDEGGSASYAVKLRTRPELSSVTLNITGGGNLLTVEPGTLTFTRETWNNEQTVTVTATDQVSAQDVRQTLTHTGDAGPDTYSLIDPGLLSVVIDRDAPGIASSGGVTVTSTPLHAQDTYALGETIAIAVRFDDDVVVDDSGGTLGVDLVAPTPPAYTAPASLKVGEAITAMNPSGGADIDAFRATGLPPGLVIDAATGAIGGTPDATGAAGTATVTVMDSAGNTATADIAFPAVARGDQVLTGFRYSAATVTFGASAPTVGETEKTVSVSVLDDSHDEGDETLTLTLSNPSGAYLADGEATGTITNTGHMPRAWLARFGRTVVDQVLEAVEGRMTASRASGTALTLAGQRVGGDGAAPGDEAMGTREAEARLATLTGWLRGETKEDRPALETRELTGRYLLAGTSFARTGGSADGGFGAVWGRGAVTRFDGREGALRLDGEVASALVGADFTGGRGTAGIVLAHSRGEGGYRGPGGDGGVSSTLTGLYPWGRYEASERLSVWGVAGYGAGTLALTPEAQGAIETDLELAMGTLGGRGVLVKPPAEGGPELAATSDALVVRTTSDEVREDGMSLAASEADVTRLRLGLEATWWGLGTPGGGRFEPGVEFGVRHDGGDVETGFGADIGAGFAWTDPSLGLKAELRARGLLTHEADGFRERGFAGALAWDPDPSTERGPSLTLRQTVGAQATGGMDALLGPERARVLGAANDDDDLRRRRLETKLGYGFALFDGRYTGVPEVGFGLTETGRETILGGRLLEARRAGLVFGLNVEGRQRASSVDGREAEHRLGLGLGWALVGARREDLELRFEASRLLPANDDPENRVGLRLTARW